MKLLYNVNIAHKADTDAVLIDGEKIKQVGQLQQFETELPAHVERIDLQGQFLSAGFIDLQLNGCGGVMLNDTPTPETIYHMHHTNVNSGCTSFLPTLITCDDETIYQAIKATRVAMQALPNNVLGLHLEGPWLNPIKKGIHPQKYVRQPKSALVELICANADVVKKVTLAPEITGIEVIRQLTQAGLVVAMGHSMASAAEVSAACEAGAQFVTHLFNAMPPIAGREPSLAGQALLSDTLYCGVIADGYHLADENLQLAYRMLKQRMVLVTDGTAASGADIDHFHFVGQPISVKNGKCFGANNTLGGSSLTMDSALRHAHFSANIPLEDALIMTSYTPAKCMGKLANLGEIAPGKIANLVALDKQLRVTRCWVAGELV